MPSPLAHTLAGIVVARATCRGAPVDGPLWYGLCAFAANAPDLDFALGLAMGDINAVHAGPSHSFAAGVGFSVAAAVVAGRLWGRRRAAFAAAIASYGSHLLLDLFCGPPERTTGLPLLWPLSSAQWLSPWRPFLGILHGRSGGGIGQFLGAVLSEHNVGAMGIEFAYLAPPVAFVWWLTREQPAVAADPAGEKG